MELLVQFVLRLAFGLALAMSLLDPRTVTSGYFRNNLYVLLGLFVVASLGARGGEHVGAAFWPAVVAALISYAGAVCWLYEAHRGGRTALGLVSLAALGGMWASASFPTTSSGAAWWLARLDPIGGGLLTGVAVAAMLLGHWYLNAPGMRLEPLRRLIDLLLLVVALRTLTSAAGLGLGGSGASPWSTTQTSLLALRWLAGLAGVGGAALMSRKTLEIPNTQSATGILYVGVIAAFLGELTAALLSAELGYPV